MDGAVTGTARQRIDPVPRAISRSRSSNRSPVARAGSGFFTWDLVDLRSFVREGEQVDDYPYGGGGGMVLKPEPVFRAWEALDSPRPFVLLSARGRPFTHRVAVELSVEPELTLLCGHYKDVDERVRRKLVTDEISLGDFVLSGGEIAALAVIDAVVRLLPGVLGRLRFGARGFVPR